MEQKLTAIHQQSGAVQQQQPAGGQQQQVPVAGGCKFALKIVKLVIIFSIPTTWKEWSYSIAAWFECFFARHEKLCKWNLHTLV